MLFTFPRLARFARPAMFLIICALAIGMIAMAPNAMAKNSKAKKPKKEKISAKAAKFEVQFLKKMIDRDARGIAAVQAADAQTTNTDLLAFDQVFLDQEKKEMQTMQDMLLKWYRTTYTPKRVHAADVEDMNEDEDEDDAQTFDEEYLGYLHGYTRSEISQFKQVAKKAGHADLKTFATGVIATDWATLAILKGWEAAWFPEDDTEVQSEN